MTVVNTQIIRTRHPRYPYLTVPAVGELLGVTRQRAWAIFKSAGLEPMRVTADRQYVEPPTMRALLEHRGYAFPRKTFSFQLVKGGVGKTTLAFSFAVRAAHYGARVLAIDLDPQGSMTLSLGLDESEGEKLPTWLDIHNGRVTAEQVIVRSPAGIDLMPANLFLGDLNDAMSGLKKNAATFIRKSLAPVRDRYDIVVIDCAPAANKVTKAATCASDLIVLPLDAHAYAAKGLEIALREIAAVSEEYEMRPDFMVVWTKFDRRSTRGFELISKTSSDERCVGKVRVQPIYTDTSFANAVNQPGLRSVFDFPHASIDSRYDIDLLTRDLLSINSSLSQNR